MRLGISPIKAHHLVRLKVFKQTTNFVMNEAAAGL
jgi:hypothetical protein